MCPDKELLASEIEKCLLKVIPKNSFIHLKVIKLYSLGRNVEETSEILGDPVNYIRRKYIDLYDLCIKHNISLPYNNQRKSQE